MSYVTNVIITCSLGNEKAIEALNYYIKEGTKFVDIGKLPNSTAGGKALETTILVGAFNYLNEGVFRDALIALPWRGWMQILLQRQHEDTFSTLWLELFE